MFRLRDPRFVHAPTAAHRRDLNAAIARLGAEIAQLELRTAMRRLKTANHLRTTLLVSVLLASSISINAKPIPKIVKETKPAIVEIVAMDEKGTPKSIGTGFFISSDGLVATNFQVIRGACSIAAINNNEAVFQFQKLVAATHRR